MAAASATPNKDIYKSKLQTLILTAVYNKHGDAVRKAVAVIRDQKLDEKKLRNGQREGKQILDFLPQSNTPVDPKYHSHSPLMLACEEENIEMVKLLLEEGASAAFKNKEGLNSLHIACKKGNLEICELLMSKAEAQNHFGKKSELSSDLPTLINPKEKRGWTPLMYAVIAGSVEITKKLLDKSVTYTTTNKREANIIHLACSKGRREILQLLVIDKSSPLPMLNEMCMATDKKGWNIIHYACSTKLKYDSEDLCFAQWLVENIPDSILSDEDKSALMKQKTKAGYSPLLIACEYQKLKTVEYLTSRADVDVSDFAEEISEEGVVGEKSALHLAAMHDSHEIAKILIEKNCEINRVDSKGNTVLHITRKKSSEQVDKVIRASPGVDKLLQMKNQADQLPGDVEPEDIIPPEIMKRGTKFIERYRQALRHGKEKIPRCGLLFLGEARTGKTSLYKLLVGQEFKPDQESTRGIDNNEVDMVDTRTVTMNWCEKTEEDQRKERDESHALAVVSELPPEEQKQEILKKFQDLNEAELLHQIDDLNSKLNEEKKPRKIRADFFPFFMEEPRAAPPHQGQPRPTMPSSPTPRRTPVPTAPKVEPKPEHVPEMVKERKMEKVTKPPPKQKEPTSISTSPPKKSATDPLPTKSESKPPPQVQRSLSSRTEAKSVNSILKTRTKRERKEPTLLLNVLDFAGQKNYRPMHHCFIRRRSVYIVVFNLQAMYKYLQELGSGCDNLVNPIEEVRYWLHSIHAHIYPPEPDQKDLDEHHRRVLLVGTHRNPGQGRQEITEDDFKRIDELLEEKLVKDNRCVNHLREVAGRRFIPVENSLTSDQNASGAAAFRAALIEIKTQLKFLDEVYPLSWLRFESKIIEMKKDRAQIKCLPEKELADIAQSKGVPDTDDALTFFHDTGNIILLKRVSKLFLSESEAGEISDLAIIDPKWLIVVMQVIMELKENDDRMKGTQLRDLKQGIISFKVLQQLWSDPKRPMPENSLIDAKKLSIILQAYCLIFPVSSFDSDQSSSNSDDSHDNQCFVIPSLLTEPTAERKAKISQNQISWISFYFDFQRFLPSEVYHRLVCMFIARANSEKSRYELTKFLCRFDKVQNCKWKIELEAPQHRIKISVKISGNSKLKPSHCVELLHKDYLKRICEESNLQGLKYHGGPLLPCQCPSGVSVFKFISFDVDREGTEENPEVLECGECLTVGSICETLDHNLKPPQVEGKSSVDENSHSGETTKRPGTLTLSTLIILNNLKDSDLDRQVDEEKEIFQLSYFFESVDNYLMPLGLNPGQQTDVKDLAFIRGTQTAMNQALKLWREPNPYNATYRALIKILLGLEKGDIAIKVASYLFTLLKPSSSSASQPNSSS